MQSYFLKEFTSVMIRYITRVLNRRLNHHGITAKNHTFSLLIMLDMLITQFLNAGSAMAIPRSTTATIQ